LRIDVGIAGLTGADLRRAILAGADLGRATLHGAQTRQTDFTDAVLTGVTPRYGRLFADTARIVPAAVGDYCYIVRSVGVDGDGRQTVTADLEVLTEKLIGRACVGAGAGAGAGPMGAPGSAAVPAAAPPCGRRTPRAAPPPTTPPTCKGPNA
jgi:hypothetical protein